MSRKPFALIAALIAVGIGLVLLWRSLEPGQQATETLTGSGEIAREDAPRASSPGAAQLETSTDAGAARADVSVSQASGAAADPGARTQSFALDGAVWIEGAVRFPDGSPPDDSLQVWAFDPSAVAGFSQQAGDLPELVRSGKFESGWWSRGAVTNTGSFRLPLPSDARSTSLLVDGQFLFLREPARVEVASLPSPLVLEPALGARIVGRCTLPPDAAPEDSPAGAGAKFSGMRMSFRPGRDGFDQVERTATIGPDRAFELRAVPTDVRAHLVVHPPRLMDARVSEMILSPGRTFEVSVPLQFGVRLEGRVVDEAGSGVQGARVDCHPEMGRAVGFGASRSEGRTATTDPSGTFTLRGIAPGKVSITARHEGYVDAESDQGALADRAVRAGLELVLARGHAVAGRVTWPDGSAASDASVEVWGEVSESGDRRRRFRRSDFSTGTTDGDGRFSVAGLGPGPYSVQASAHRAMPGAAAGRENEPGENLPRWIATAKDVPLGAQDLVLALREPLSLAGRVVDDLGKPVLSFTIEKTSHEAEMSGRAELGSQSFVTEDGAFVLVGLQPGEWDLEAVADGYVGPEEPSKFQVPGEGEPVVLVLSRGGTATGTVLDPDGKPVAKAKVFGATASPNRPMWGRDAGPSTETLADGTFRIFGLPIGSVDLVAESEGFAPSEKVAAMTEPGALVEDLVLHLRRGGTLTGEVYDKNGQPARGRSIHANTMTAMEMRMQIVDAEGRFAFEHLSPGAYQVMCEPSEAEQAEMARKAAEGGEQDMSEMFASLKMTSAQVKDGETTHVVLGALPKAPVRLFGRVTRGGEPVRSGTLMCIGEGGALLSKFKIAPVRASGDYEVQLDEPGDYVVTFEELQDGHGSMEFEVTIPEEKEHRLDLALYTGGIRGTIRGPDGANLAGVGIQILSDGTIGSLRGMDGGLEKSDENGRFEILGLSAGTYALAAGGTHGMFADEHPAYGRTVVTGIEVGKDAIRDGVEIRLSRPGTLAGIVRNSDGAPVSGAAVFAIDTRGEPVNRFSHVVTDASGRFRYEGVAPGRYAVLARTKDLASPESAPVDVRESEVQEIELSAGRGTVLRISVQGPEGAALRASFSVRDEHGHELGGLLAMDALESLMAEGISSREQRVGPLPPGEYKVAATTHDGRRASKPVKLRGQEERKLVLHLD